MQDLTRNAVRGAFGALILAGLGFGAGQALAAPALVQSAGSCTRIQAAFCNGYCSGTYGTSYKGLCTQDTFGNVTCECVPIFP